MKFSNEFASCGLNPVPHCLDCQHQNGACFVAFGSSHSVVVTRIPDGAPEGCGGTIVMVASIDQKDTVSRNKVPETDAVVGDYRDMESYIPTPRVNTVKFVGDGIHLLVGTSDGRVLLYKGYDTAASAGEPALVRSLGPYLTKTTDLFYSPSILCIDAAFYPENGSKESNKLLIVATTACGLALIWDGLDAFAASSSPQMYKTNNCLLEACAIGVLAGIPLIALGCTDNKSRILRRGSDGLFAEGACLVGHLDWVRALSFSPSFSEDGGHECILLATGSQDTNVRVWRVTLGSSGSVDASLDSVLNGHDDWVTGVAWCGPRRLLSVSMDRTLSLWLPDADAGVWISSIRLWGVPGSLLGGSVFGFHSLALVPDGSAVFAHGYTGAIHRWDFTPSLLDPALSAANPPSAVQRATVPAGHTNFVTSVAWSRAPECPSYLVSAGEDKTVRIYAQQKGERWYELARPLVHGHSVRRMCVVGRKHMFAVASEEKAIRLFDAPSTFIRSLFNIAGQEMGSNISKDADARPFGAVLPPLSLSNRPVYKNGDAIASEEDPKAAPPDSAGQAAPSQPDDEEEYEVNEEEGNDNDYSAGCPSTPTELFAPPFEDHLTHNTMWPEARKLFAHVSEATCVASSVSTAKEPVVVSGCSAFRAGEATVCVWNPDAHVPMAVLQRHRGPVVDVCVSCDGNLALSISLDMSIMLWGSSATGEGDGARQKWNHLFTHERAFTKPPIACRWSPSCDIVAIAGPAATGVHLYRIGDLGDGQMCCSKCGEIQTKTRTTSVAWCPDMGPDAPLFLAVGMDSGAIEVWKVERPSLETNVVVELVGSVPTQIAHVSSVNSLDWNYPTLTDGKWSALLASGGSDNFVRITKVSF